MKRLFIILSVVVLVSTNLFAQFRDETEKIFFARTYGPIKQITTVIYVDGEENEYWHEVRKFDSIGIVERYCIDKDGSILETSRRNYHYIDSNSCWCYYYKHKRRDVIGFASEDEEDTIKIFFNDKGEPTKIVDKNSCLIDSFVYDMEGLLIEQHQRDNNGEMKLLYKYTYDSLGRLIKEQGFEPYYKYVDTYKYQPSGDYKRCFILHGKRLVMKGFVNSEGQLIKLKDDEIEMTYMNYDKQGNWLKVEVMPSRPASKTRHAPKTRPTVYERIIEYF